MPPDPYAAGGRGRDGEWGKGDPLGPGLDRRVRGKGTRKFLSLVTPLSRSSPPDSWSSSPVVCRRCPLWLLGSGEEGGDNTFGTESDLVWIQYPLVFLRFRPRRDPGAAGNTHLSLVAVLQKLLRPAGPARKELGAFPRSRDSTESSVRPVCVPDGTEAGPEYLGLSTSPSPLRIGMPCPFL